MVLSTDPLRRRAALRLSVVDSPRLDEFIDMLTTVQSAYLGLSAIEYVVDNQRDDWPTDSHALLRDLEGVVRIQSPLVVARIRMESPGAADILGKTTDLLRVAGRIRRKLGDQGRADVKQTEARADDLHAHAELQRAQARLVNVTADLNEIELFERVQNLGLAVDTSRLVAQVQRRLERVDRVVERGLITDAEVRDSEAAS